MKLTGYTCPGCDAYSPTVDGAPTDDGLTVACPVCGNVETIRRTDPPRTVTP